MNEEQIVSKTLSPEKELELAYKYIEDAKFYNPIVRATFEYMRGIDLGEVAPYIFLCRLLLEENNCLKGSIIHQEMTKR